MMQLYEDEGWDKEHYASATPRTPAARRSPAQGAAQAAQTQGAAIAPAQGAADAAPSTLPPLTADNARRRLVVVPSSRYPRHTCHEHNGQGWEAQVLSATRVSAVVRYLRARTADGRPYEDTREPLASLRPIT